jgi:hypothetical protein
MSWPGWSDDLCPVRGCQGGAKHTDNRPGTSQSRTSHDNEFPLTLSQQDIYFDQLKRGDSSVYNIGGYIGLGAIDVPRLG